MKNRGLERGLDSAKNTLDDLLFEIEELENTVEYLEREVELRDDAIVKLEELVEEYTLMNKPLLSLNDLLSVWSSDVDIERYKESPLFKNFKDLASGKI